MAGKVELEPVGFVRSTRKEVKDDNWDRENSLIELLPDFPKDSLQAVGKRVCAEGRGQAASMDFRINVELPVVKGRAYIPPHPLLKPKNANSAF